MSQITCVFNTEHYRPCEVKPFKCVAGRAISFEELTDQIAHVLAQVVDMMDEGDDLSITFEASPSRQMHYNV